MIGLRFLLLLLVLEAGCQLTVFGGYQEFGFSAAPSHAELARYFESEGEYKRAIDEYETHIALREQDDSRPATEDPKFYYLFIGDLYLKLEKPLEAEASYLKAIQDETTKPLLAYRLRDLGAWYEARGELEKAIETLRAYRDLDSLMFDHDIDRIHKKSVLQEQEQELLGESPSVDSSNP